MIVTAVTGMPLDAAVAELVTGPLGMTRTCFRPGPQQANSAASTEPQPDGTALTGVVHDENARFFGGVSGHAGLFAPADDLARYLTAAWLGDELLSPVTVREACRLQTEGTGGRRGLDVPDQLLRPRLLAQHGVTQHRHTVALPLLKSLKRG